MAHEKPPAAGSGPPATVGVGSDHAGWELKEQIVRLLGELGLEARDHSAAGPVPVDYPDVACRIAAEVAAGALPRGILICGTGLGMAITANRHPRVRATPCYDSYTARMSREHNDSNVLVLGARVTGPDLALDIVRVWLTTPFAGGRHARRVAKIDSLAPRTEGP